ncbi:cell surface protein [Bifidobacterium sp. 82T25]|nr:cell surface protein [Bifidobacterium miconisargentati]
MPGTYARDNGGVTIASDSGVTVISNGNVVTDGTIVSAAESLRTRTADAAKNNVTPIDSFSDESEPAFSTNTILNQQNSDAFATDGNQSSDNGDSTGETGTNGTGTDDATSGDGADAGAGKDDSSGAADGSATDSDDSAGSGAGSGSDESNKSDDSGDASDTQTHAVSTALGGRDFTGQVTKTINGKTYILIGNEQQLRAIGTDKKVIKPIWKIETEEYQKDACTETILGITYKRDCWVDIPDVKTQTYVGDADLDANTTLRNKKADSDNDGSLFSSVGDRKYHYVTLDDQGNEVEASKTSADTGQTYSATANYIIFRDIDLSKNAAKPADTKWSPLMFSGTMVGAVAVDGDSQGNLFEQIAADGLDVANDTVAKPVISNVVVHQTGELDTQSQQGVGFFASISPSTTLTAGRLAGSGRVTVSNLKLSDVTVSNESTKAKDNSSLLGIITEGLGFLLDTLLGPLNLNLQKLLTLHAENPSNFATGAFAGRVYGDSHVSRCEVENVSVSNVKSMTGGFVGYTEGSTQYDVVLSGTLGGLTGLLTKILNLIPYLGAGDLINWLLSGTLGLDSLIPVAYDNPVISNSTVTNFKEGVTLGNADSDFAGGFVGQQAGAIIERSKVTSANAFTVQAALYAGGFAGVSRDGAVGGLLNSLDISLLSLLKPQSIIEESAVEATGGLTVKSGAYAGGFAGALANSYAVNDDLHGGNIAVQTTTTVEKTTESYAGGFVGKASVGWAMDLGSSDDSSKTVVKSLVNLVNNLLQNNGLDTDTSGDLLSLAGVNPSIVLGTDINATALDVSSAGDYAGGIVGEGDGTIIGDSSSDHLGKFAPWKQKYSGARPFPEQRSTAISGLSSVKANGSYAGGVAGSLQPATVAALLNDTLGITSIGKHLGETNQFMTFEASNITLEGLEGTTNGLTVTAEDHYAGGVIGCGTGGDLTNVQLSQLASVKAKGAAGGYAGFTGPGSVADASGVNLLGLVKISGLLSVAEYSAVTVNKSNVEGVENGFTVEASGNNKDGGTGDYTAGGFYGQANSTNTRESHVTNLKSVTADATMDDGLAGGFVGYSTTGGLAEAVSDADDTELLKNPFTGSLLSIDDLLGAVPYLIPNYLDTTVTYVDGGYVEGDAAGGFAGDFQSGKVNQISDADIAKDATLADVQTLVTSDSYAAVVNIDHVTGGAYAGGFGGKVESGALASAGKGGISLLGKLGTVKLSQLVSLVQGYVPYISYASVHSDDTTVETANNDTDKSDDAKAETTGDATDESADDTAAEETGNETEESGKSTDDNAEKTDGKSDESDGTTAETTDDEKDKSGDTTDKTTDDKTSGSKDYGFTVIATRIDSGDSQSGAAGGYIGYGSGVQVSHSNVTQLRHTDVKAPSNLETTKSIDSTYLSGDSSYAVTGARYAGGYIGMMDIGSAASVGDGISLLGEQISITDMLSVLNVVVSTIEHSDVKGGIGGYSVLASAADHKDGDGEDDPLGMAGGFAGHIMGGHIQDSNSHEFVYIIGQVSAGGYVGTMEPGDVAHVMGSGNVLKKIADIDNLLSLAQDFVPTIRNSSTDAAICGGAVRAQASSGTKTRRGMAGGYVGHNSGGHIWGNNTKVWKSENTDGKYNGTQRVAYAARIRSVYGQEIAGGYNGLMESASTAKGGSLSLLFGVITVGNLANVLTAVYPTEEHTKVTGPLRNMAYSQWETWHDNVGKYGAYGKEFTDVVTAGGAKDVKDQESLDKFLEKYVFGFNVVAGRGEYDGEKTATMDSGVAGGYVGLMRTGTITDGQSWDVKRVSALRAAGGYAGTMESGTAASFGSVELFGKNSLFGESLANVNLGQLLGLAQVFVPVVKSSSVLGYRKGMKVQATGIGVTKGIGNAGGYVGMAVGGQIWGDRDADGNELASGTTAHQAAGANVSNLRKVSGTNNVGGYIGIATSGAVADVNTDGIGGFLHKITDQVLTPGKLVSVLDATVVTIRGAHVTPDNSEWGYTVEGSYQDGDETKYALNAGGFAGSLQASILGDKKSAKGTGTSVDTANDPAAVTVTGLRGVEGGQYAGGFFGLADISSVASVAGGEAAADQSTNLVLKLIKAGNISVLDAFRTFIYDGRVDGVADGIQVKAHDSTTQGTLDSTRFTGSAGGFGGGLINGSVKKSSVTNLNSVTGLNYTGGFIGHLGKAGTVDADNIGVAKDYLVDLTAGVLDIWGAHVEDSAVSGIPAGFTVAATHNGKDYGQNESLTDSKNRKGEEIAAGFAGYADLSRISNSTVTNFKKVSSGELAGGFVGQTTKAYLVDAGVNSAVVNMLIKYLINPLLDILYIDKIENIGNKLDDYKEAHFGALTKYLDLELFTDGNALYVNLLGLKIGVALDKHGTEADDTDDTAEIFIGDSSVTVGCSKKGVNSGSVDNVHAQLIKANRTKIASSSVEGIADGYDVFGGGATQDSDGVEGVKTGYAGGFAAVNDEGLLEKNTMTYADTIRGTSGLVGPFTGKTNLKSVYSFNTVYGIEGNGNTYRIYRDVPSSWSYVLTKKNHEQFTYGSHLDNETYAEHGVDMTGTHKLTLNRYIVAHLAKSGDKDPAIKQFSDYEGAVMSNNPSGSNTGEFAPGVKNEAKSLGVYVSAAKAVLMLDTAVADNNGGLTPEPDDGQDPCGENGCQTVDLTLQKVWRNGQLERPDSITLEVTATYTDANGEQQAVKKLECFKDDCTTEERDNPFTVTMSAKENGSLWSDTWRTKVTGLPVAFVDKGSGADGEDVVRYYTYTVKEISMTFDTGEGATKTPAQAGYSVSVDYGQYADGKYVATVTNYSPLPETGGNGIASIMLAAVLVFGLGAAWTVVDGRRSRVRSRGRHLA